MQEERRKESINAFFSVKNYKMAKKRLKPILPSLREKKRYLAFEVISKSRVYNYNSIAGAIHNSLLQLIGELGAGKAGIKFLEDKFNQELQRGLVKVNHKYVDHLRASLALINDIDEKEVIVRSVGVSGILKKAEKKYLAS